MQPRMPQYVDRDRQPRDMVLTDRDQRILEHLHAHGGVLADYQIQHLEFTGRRQMQDRMSKLFHNGYIQRTSRAGWLLCGCAVYWLNKTGAEYVAGAHGLSLSEFSSLYTREPRWSQISHDLLTVDFTLALFEACAQNPNFEVFEWLNERDFRVDPDTVEYKTINNHQVKRQMMPDRYFAIDWQSGSGTVRSRLLLELDNATHPNKRFANEKVLPGLAYIRSGKYQRRFGSNSGRWLVVTTSPNRLEYLKSTTEKAAEDNARVWHFTTFEQISAQSVLTEPIWIRGGETQLVALFDST